MSEFWVPIDPGALRRERAKADHVVPMGRGGRSTRGYVVPACKDCNSKKQSMVPVEWQAYLRSLGAVSDD